MRTVLHEMAHVCLRWHSFIGLYTSHGPGFNRKVLQLYTDHLGLDKDTLFELANICGVPLLTKTEMGRWIKDKISVNYKGPKAN